MTAPRVLVVDGGTPCRGTVRTPGEKSISHRSVLLGALAEGTSVIHGLSDGADVAASLAAVEAMGAGVERHDDGTVVMHGGRARLHRPDAPLDCGNSGTSMRLLAGLVAGFDWETELIGDESLSSRPMDRVAEPLGLMGATVAGQGARCLPPLRVRGGALHGIDWTSKVASAQVKSAIILAGLSAEGTTTVREAVTTRTHTEEMLTEAGADLTVEPWGEGRIVARAGVLPQAGRPHRARRPLRLGLLRRGGVRRARQHGRRGRRLRRAGPARLRLRPASGWAPPSRWCPAIPARRPSGPPPARCTATEVQASEIPSLDEIPALAVAAAVAAGHDGLHRRGRAPGEGGRPARRRGRHGRGVRRPGHASTGDTLAITGVGGPLRGARFDSQGDHRMAMAAAVAALAARPGERSLITGFGAVETSYPTFAEDLERLAAGRRGRPGRCWSPLTGRPEPGKSTVSRAVAERLGVDRLDTGAMYRAVAALALELGTPPEDSDGRGGAGRRRRPLRWGSGSTIDGRDVTGVIRSPEVGRAVSVVAANAEVRRHLVERQRAWAAAHGGGVVEGRDIGSVVFPEAELKVYLTASPEERARRRNDEAPEGVARRDRIDSTRDASPLREAEDAHRLDTTGRTVQDVVEEVLSWL